MAEGNNHLVIMAGGVGSRLYPMSTLNCPKQFIDVLGCGKTLLQLTYERFLSVVPRENVWVVTSESYKDLVAEQLPDIPQEQILLEPCRRNTAPCIAYASWRIKSLYPHANIVVSPSDHVVTDTDEFARVIRSSLNFVSESDAIVTLGMKPDRPETGYGYIQADLRFSTARNKEIFRVDSFHEKPSLELAEKYIRQTNFYWNAGIFIWNVNTIINAFRVYQPDISAIFENMLPYYNSPKESELIREKFPLCESISVDYAILENAEEIYVFPADFGWSDVGTWHSLQKTLSTDTNGNTCVGKQIETVDTRNCIIHTTNFKKVVVQGLDGYLIVEQNGELLICKIAEEKNFHNRK